MSFLEKTYVFADHYGSTHELTAKQLCSRVLEDSKLNFNWLAPASELVRICKDADFPAEYSLPIKIAILNCFANVNHQANCGSDRYITYSKDAQAVQYCYNSLYNVDTEEAVSARKRYLTEIIATASQLHVFDPLFHFGSTFQKLREDWNNSKFEEYISKENIDFKELEKSLRINFAEIIKAAEVNGDFAEDDAEDDDAERALCQKIMGVGV